MNHWKRTLLALAAPLMLTGCLWGPGKFASDLTLKRDGTFVLDYRGEIVIQLPPDGDMPRPWSADLAHCYVGTDGTNSSKAVILEPGETPKERACTKAEAASQKAEYEQRSAAKLKENQEMAKAMGLPGLDDASNRAFAAKLTKYAGWRSATYRGKGVFDVDYHVEGRATQDFIFPTLPDNDLIIPFVAIKRRNDGSVLVSAPALTGGSGPIAARAGAAAASKMGDGPQSKAEGRFSITTDGEILTNNSEDGPAPHPLGRQLHWDVGPGSTKIPEALVRLQ
ncbi:MAG TPA: hypothetical protein VM145_03925 [Sphingomicrobium sp.]|nr:hypothetical protein [Sphingomicrobium sp.]